MLGCFSTRSFHFSCCLLICKDQHCYGQISFKFRMNICWPSGTEVKFVINFYIGTTGHVVVSLVKPLPNNKFLVMTKFKAFEDNKLNIAIMPILGLCDRVEKTVGKEENAGYQNLLFPLCFPRPSALGLLKDRIVVKSQDTL